jgi:molybdate transport system regulatory protein
VIAATTRMKPTAHIRIRIPHGDDFAIGPGKAVLLEAIQRTGSISAAGRELNMSYRRAWLLVDSMNRCFRKPLVDSTAGGRAGGGAHVTDFGLDVLQRFRAMEKAARAAIEPELTQLAQLLARKRRG